MHVMTCERPMLLLLYRMCHCGEGTREKAREGERGRARDGKRGASCGDGGKGEGGARVYFEVVAVVVPVLRLGELSTDIAHQTK